jgi:MFS superfamily sulfate permease-like transporter
VATRVLPCLVWMQNYDVKKQLLRDIAAGVAVTFLIIPQGLSYAGIAGLPAIYGLCVCPCHRLALATCSCTDAPCLGAQTLIFCRSFFSRCSPARSTCRLAPWRWCRC